MKYMRDFVPLLILLIVVAFFVSGFNNWFGNGWAIGFSFFFLVPLLFVLFLRDIISNAKIKNIKTFKLQKGLILFLVVIVLVIYLAFQFDSALVKIPFTESFGNWIIKIKDSIRTDEYHIRIFSIWMQSLGIGSLLLLFSFTFSNEKSKILSILSILLAIAFYFLFDMKYLSSVPGFEKWYLLISYFALPIGYIYLRNQELNDSILFLVGLFFVPLLAIAIIIAIIAAVASADGSSSDSSDDNEDKNTNNKSIDGDVTYWADGTIRQFGNKDVSYWPDGTIRQIGDNDVTYWADGTIKQVGNKDVSYWADGTIKQIGDNDVSYWPDGTIKNVDGKK